MNKVLIVFLVILILNSCDKKTGTEKLAKFDKNGKLIVYNEKVYAKMWLKNRNLNVTVIDTFCENQKSKALKDIKKGKLIYFGFHPREFQKMTKILNKFGIETKEQLRHCVRMGGFEPFCYEYEMHKEIRKKFGVNFIDSIIKVAQKESVLENPNEEYIVDGIDLREKYLNKKNSH
ncbi:hypothetical protein ABF174_002425 [Flavobacterium psychrophilum]|jgi:hypothetical protein